MESTGDSRDETTEARAKTEDWPFGDDPRPLEGYLRALNPRRDDLIKDRGEGIRIYPQRNRPTFYIYNANLETCSGDLCHDNCPHAWEDRFRFGKFKGRRFVPPANRLKIGAKPKNSNIPYDGVIRVRPRPNPMIDGKRYATKMRHARIAIPAECNDLLRNVLDAVKLDIELETSRKTRQGYALQLLETRGRKSVPVEDLLFASVARIQKRLTYEALDAELRKLYHAGYIGKSFKFPRVVEAMNDIALTDLLDRVIKKLIRVFRNIAKVLVLDGVVFSTARTDNSRTKRFTDGEGGPVQMTVSALYEIRFGFLVAFRITWFQRGRGSGESPQFPFLVRQARERLSNFELLIADTAYASIRNRQMAHQLDFDFVCKPKKLRSDAKKAETLIDDPILNQIYPFRNRVEGWHDVLRETTEPYMISRPERSNYPAQTKKEKLEAERLKSDPEYADAELPDDMAEREAIILSEQFVGIAPNNEMRIRQVVSLLRSMVKAQIYYNEKNISFTTDFTFTPRVEDDYFSIYRPPSSPKSDLLDVHK